MKLEVDTEEVLDRMRMTFLNGTRTCEFVKDFPEISIGSKKLGPFKRGQQTELPNWVIEKLKQHKVVKINPTDNYDSVTIVDNLYREEQRKKHSALQALPPHLYASVSRRILYLQHDKTSLDPMSMDTIERLQNRLKSLVETRQPKIIRAAISDSCTKWQNHMTNEERWLCEKLYNTVSKWRAKMME